MPRYFFHIRDNAQLISDEEGTELPDLDAARREAALSARAIVVEAIETPEPWDHVEIEIWNERQMLEVVQLGVILTDKDSTMH